MILTNGNRRWLDVRERTETFASEGRPPARCACEAKNRGVKGKTIILGQKLGQP